MVIITDIFGNNNINNNTEFIIIYGNDLNTYLTLKDSLNINDNTLTDETSQIYTVNKDNINDLFNKNNLNLKNFILSSDLLILNNTININKILFINKNIGKIPEDFISIELYNKGTIWEPIGVLGYKSIGLIYNSGNKKPKLNTIYMLPIDILLKINYGPYEGLNTFNEFKNLSNNIYGYWTIDREKISQDTNDYFKLISYDGKYLTNINDNLSVVNSKNTNDDPNQIIKYSINGDIIIKNKCLYNNNNKLMLGQCDNNNNNIDNKWSFINNNIVSNKNNHCLTLDANNKIVLEECDDQNQYQQFTKETPDFINHNDFKWENNKGRNVILTFNDNPWYQNKDLNKEIKSDLKANESKINNKFKIPDSLKPKVSTYGLKNNYAKYNNSNSNNNNSNNNNNNNSNNSNNNSNNNNNNSNNSKNNISNIEKYSKNNRFNNNSNRTSYSNNNNNNNKCNNNNIIENFGNNKNSTNYWLIISVLIIILVILLLIYKKKHLLFKS